MPSRRSTTAESLKTQDSFDSKEDIFGENILLINMPPLVIPPQEDTQKNV